MRIALVHDYLNQYGGAERVLEVFCEIWPEAPIYTLIYDEKRTYGAFGGKEIYTSFLQSFPFAKAHHRPFLFLMPTAVEQFDLSKYDIVISDSASYIKGVITKPNTLHICYCHTPTRYLWDDCHKYTQEFYYAPFIKRIIPFFLNYLRLWDEAAAWRVDKFIANSKFVSMRIKKYYQREAEVIYPPVNTDFFIPISQAPAPKSDFSDNIGSSTPKSEDYFLMVARFLPYKKIDLTIEAFNQLGLPLIIVGDGREKSNLQKKAESNIKFVGSVPNNEVLKDYYLGCKALIFPQEEDFGLTAVEAMACGKPVIAYRAGGALETIKDGITGLFFKEQTVESLMVAVQSFRSASFDAQIIRRHALQFDKKIFKDKIEEFVEKEWEKFKVNL